LVCALQGVRRIIARAAAVALLTVGQVDAQSRPALPRLDATGYVGWLAVDGDAARPGGRGWHDSLFGAVGAGWYWTEHLRTEIDMGAGTAASAYRLEPVMVDRAQLHQASESTFSRRTLGLGQYYQYGRNAWFHPHIGAGVHLTWERRRTHYHPLVVYEGGSLPGRILREGYTEGPATTWAVRPFAAAGFKGYLNPRVFFRGDVRLAFRRGLEESLVRAGIGVDF
jgi:hypothetical protein